MIIDGCSGESPVDRSATIITLSGGFGVCDALELEIDAAAFGQVGDSVYERERLEIHDELDSITAFITAETVVKVPFCIYGE